MHRQFVSLLVAVVSGVMPLAHEICLAGCSGTAAITAHSRHHDDGAHARGANGAHGPEHQMAGHAMYASDVAVMGQQQGPATVKEMALATRCCASVLATPRCCRSGDDSTPLVSTVKRMLDPLQPAVAHVIAMLGPPVGDHPASFVDAVFRSRVSLARLTPLRI